ncbi:MAG TPA: ATP-binding protein [Polyangia bacterium]
MRGLLVLSLVTMLVGMLLVQAILFRHRFRERYAQEVSANLEVARAVGAGFESFVHDVVAAEATLGSALTQPTRLTPAEVNRVLAATRAEYPAAREVSWATPQGRIVASSDPAVVGLDLTPRDYYQQIVGGRDWAVGDLFQARVGPDPLFVIARGVRDDHRELRGIALTAVNPRRLGFEPLAIQRTGSASLMLFDRADRLVYRRPEVALSWDRRTFTAARPLVERARAGAEVTGTFVSRLDGRKKIAAFVALPALGWVVGASRPTAEITGPLLRSLARDQGAALAVTALALLLALGLARAVALPVQRLEGYAVAVAAGGREPPPAFDRPVEVARLGRAFGHMVDETQGRERELEGRTEEARRAVELLRTAIATVPLGVMVTDADGVFTLTNPTVDAILGARAAGTSMRDRPLAVLLRPDGSVMPREEMPLVRALERREAVRDFELVIRRPRGGDAVVLGAASPVIVKGEVVGAVAAFQDVTERRRHERERLELLEAAARSAAELEAIFAAMAEGVVTYGPRGEIVRVNPAAAAALPHTEAERALPLAERWACFPVARPDGTPFPLDDSPVARALRGEVVRGVVMVVRRPDREVWVSASGAPLRTPEGRVTGAVVTLTDISRLHELQEQHEDVLRAVSHDLRTPLSVIQLQAQRLGRALADAGHASERQAAVSIETAARRMGTMINELVESARLEAGQLKLDLRPLDVGQEIRDLLARSGDALDRARLKVDVPPLPPVRADGAAFERIIGNLISNALKYSPAGTRVEIGAWRRGGELVIAVCDHGPGIAEEDRQRLFHRFWRAGGASGRKEGLGLGLYISSRLVAAHGGQIWVESAPGEGSTFAFTLPLVDPDAPG